MTNCKYCKAKNAELKVNLNRFCNYDCACSWAQIASQKAQGKAMAKKAAEVRQSDREKKEAFKSRNKWLAELQDIFNKFIRLRDTGLPCVSCGRSEQEVEAGHGWKAGGAWDAGHYLSRGSHPELRFVEDNVMRQCKSCNGGSGNYARKNHEVQKAFRVELINRIGLDRVEWLEGKHDPLKLTIDEIKALKKHYSDKCKELTGRI